MDNKILFRYRLDEGYAISGKKISSAMIAGVKLTSDKDIDGEFKWTIFNEENKALTPWVKTPENKTGIIVMQKFDREVALSSKSDAVTFDSESPNRTVYTFSELGGMKREELTAIAEKWNVKFGAYKKEKVIDMILDAMKTLEATPVIKDEMPAPVDSEPVVEPVAESNTEVSENVEV